MKHDDRQKTPEPGGIARPEAYVNSSVLDSRVGGERLSDESIEWLREQGLTAESVVKMERVRRDHVDTWSFILNWATGGTRQRVQLLRLLAENRMGVTYQDVFDQLDVSDRRSKEFVKELRDEDIVETPGRPAQIRFTDDTNYLLAVDVAAWL